MIAPLPVWLVQPPRNRSGNSPVRRDPPRFVMRQELCRRAPAGLILEMDVGPRVPIAVADDGAGFGLLGGKPRPQRMVSSGELSRGLEGAKVLVWDWGQERITSRVHAADRAPTRHALATRSS